MQVISRIQEVVRNISIKDVIENNLKIAHVAAQSLQYFARDISLKTGVLARRIVGAFQQHSGKFAILLFGGLVIGAVICAVKSTCKKKRVPSPVPDNMRLSVRGEPRRYSLQTGKRRPEGGLGIRFKNEGERKEKEAGETRRVKPFKIIVETSRTVAAQVEYPSLVMKLSKGEMNFLEGIDKIHDLIVKQKQVPVLGQDALSHTIFDILTKKSEKELEEEQKQNKDVLEEKFRKRSSALFEGGMLYLKAARKENSSKKEEEARKWFLAAFEKGEREALWLYGCSLTAFIDKDSNIAQLLLPFFEALKKDAEAGCDPMGRAEYVYGVVLCEGHGCKVDQVQGRLFLERAAKKGLEIAKFFLSYRKDLEEYETTLNACLKEISSKESHAEAIVKSATVFAAMLLHQEEPASYIDQRALLYFKDVLQVVRKCKETPELAQSVTLIFNAVSTVGKGYYLRSKESLGLHVKNNLLTASKWLELPVCAQVVSDQEVDQTFAKSVLYRHLESDQLKGLFEKEARFRTKQLALGFWFYEKEKGAQEQALRSFFGGNEAHFFHYVQKYTSYEREALRFLAQTKSLGSKLAEERLKAWNEKKKSSNFLDLLVRNRPKVGNQEGERKQEVEDANGKEESDRKFWISIFNCGCLFLEKGAQEGDQEKLQEGCTWLKNAMENCQFERSEIDKVVVNLKIAVQKGCADAEEALLVWKYELLIEQLCKEGSQDQWSEFFAILSNDKFCPFRKDMRAFEILKQLIDAARKGNDHQRAKYYQSKASKVGVKLYEKAKFCYDSVARKECFGFAARWLRDSVLASGTIGPYISNYVKSMIHSSKQLSKAERDMLLKKVKGNSLVPFYHLAEGLWFLEVEKDPVRAKEMFSKATGIDDVIVKRLLS